MRRRPWGEGVVVTCLIQVLRIRVCGDEEFEAGCRVKGLQDKRVGLKQLHSPRAWNGRELLHDHRETVEGGRKSQLLVGVELRGVLRPRGKKA